MNNRVTCLASTLNLILSSGSGRKAPILPESVCIKVAEIQNTLPERSHRPVATITADLLSLGTISLLCNIRERAARANRVKKRLALPDTPCLMRAVEDAL